MMSLLLLVLGAFGGFLSGLLGVGGAILMIPLMLYVPPLLNTGALDMKIVSGLSMIQVLFSSLSAIYRHRKYHFVHGKLFAVMGSGMLIGSTTGSVLSVRLEGLVITVVFGLLSAGAALLMLLSSVKSDDRPEDSGVEFNPLLAFGLALFTGLLSGIVGAGGGFILFPIMVQILKIPLRVTIGTSIAVVFVGALSGGIGKMITAQVQWEYAIPLVLGSIPFAQLGGIVSKRTSPKALRFCLLAVILVTCVQVWADILSRP